MSTGIFIGHYSYLDKNFVCIYQEILTLTHIRYFRLVSGRE